MSDQTVLAHTLGAQHALEVTGPASGRQADQIEACVQPGEIIAARAPQGGGPHQALLLARMQCAQCRLGVGAPLHLDKGQHLSPARYQVNLAKWRARPARQNLPASNSQP